MRGSRDRGGRSGIDAEVIYGIHPVREALRAGRRKTRRLRVRAGRGRPELAEIISAARAAGIPIEEASDEALTRGLSFGVSHQGVVLEAGAVPEVELSDLIGSGSESRTLVALDGVVDPQNLGAIIRVAEAAGVAGLILTRRRSPPLSPAVARASAGAVEWLAVARVPNLVRALNRLKTQGFWVFGADPGGDLDLFRLPDRVAAGNRVLVLGAEGKGLRPAIFQTLDHRVQIPTVGQVASLNVSTAAAVLLFELRRRTESSQTGNLARTDVLTDENPSSAGC